MSAIYSWRQLSPVHHPSARVEAGLAFIFAPIGTLLFGGVSAGPTLNNDTWFWDGTDWTLLAPVHKPSARSGDTLAYDFANNYVLLFGGTIDAAGHGDAQTWKFDGTDWTQLAPAHSPSARAGAALWGDANFGNVRLFGGRTNPIGPVWNNETWTWDGTDWTQETPVHSPPALENPAVAYSQSLLLATLFGGNITGVGVQAGTWQYDGTDWTQRAPAASPAARASARSMQFGPFGDVVLFGGSASPTVFFADTWDWNGHTWANVSPTSSPSGRTGHAFDFDNIGNGGLLFGGQAQGGGLLGDTWLLEIIGRQYETAWGYGGVAPQGGGDRTTPLYLQSALPRLDLTPGCTIRVRSQKPDGTLRAADRWTEATLWVDDGS